MRIFFDTEFTHLGAEAELLSAGFIAENGESLYLEITDFNPAFCSQFVKTVVQPLFDAPPENRVSLNQFHVRLANWLISFRQDIELVSDQFFDWDFVNSVILRESAQKAGFKIESRIFQPSPNAELEILEKLYWEQNKGRQHHALVDAALIRQRFEKAVEHD